MNPFAGVICEGCGRISETGDPKPRYKCMSCGTLLLNKHRTDSAPIIAAPTHAQYASFSQRFSAGLIDGLLFFLITIPLKFVAGLLPFLTSIHVLGFIGLLYPLYFVFAHYKFGRTLGKKLMGISVVSCASNEWLSLDKSLLRESVPLTVQILAIISTFSALGLWMSGDDIQAHDIFWMMMISTAASSVNFIWFVLEVITLLLNEKRRAIHDFMAGSIVVRG